MPRFRTLEDGFEYRVKLIFTKLYEDYKEVVRLRIKYKITDKYTFTDFLYESKEDVGEIFLNDVESYMGIEETVKTLKVI